jgi:hypothetical protein
MQPITVTVGPLDAADDNGIAESQTTAGAANLTLDGVLVTGGVAILDTPRQVIVTSGGNDTGVTFTIYGTTYGGQSVSEAITGASGGASATKTDFATVTRVAASGATSVSGVIVGTNAKAGSRWVRMDSWAFPQTVVQVNVNGTADFTVQTTMDDPNSPTNPVAIGSVTWLDTLDTNLVTTSVSTSGFIAYSTSFVRVLLNSGSGSVTATFSQFGNVPL